MTIDQDRGAYAPHMDAPLAFDARRPSDRRPLPMTLIASAGVLVLIVGALAMAYRGGVRGSEQPRLVGEPVGPIKTAAAPEAASDAASVDSRMDVYAAQNVPARPPSFAPKPEEPRARLATPVAAAPVAAAPVEAAPVARASVVSAPVAASSPPAPSGLQVRTVDPVKVRIGEPEITAAPVRTAADRQAAATSRTAITPGAADRPPVPVTRPVAVAQSSRPAGAGADAATPIRVHGATKTVAASDTLPTAVKATRAPADEAASPAKSGAAAVQVGAFSTAELAQKGFADAGKLSSLGGHARSVEKVVRDGKTYYRATLGGFADKAAARAFCAQLAAKGGRCLVKS